jgi:hypothetical protein
VRLTLDMLGHHVEFTIDHPADDGVPQREGSADALVERAHPHRTEGHELDHRPIGFRHQETQ